MFTLSFQHCTRADEIQIHCANIRLVFLAKRFLQMNLFESDWQYTSRMVLVYNFPTVSFLFVLLIKKVISLLSYGFVFLTTDRSKFNCRLFSNVRKDSHHKILPSQGALMPELCPRHFLGSKYR